MTRKQCKEKDGCFGEKKNRFYIINLFKTSPINLSEELYIQDYAIGLSFISYTSTHLDIEPTYFHIINSSSAAVLKFARV